MNSDKLAIVKAVESRQEKFWRISDAIWSYAELGLEEYRSAKLLADGMEAAGFRVDRGVAGMPTAFVATWSHGSGKPAIGFLGEYDALPMLSQKAGVPKKDPLVPGAPGHGCSHNTMCHPGSNRRHPQGNHGEERFERDPETLRLPGGRDSDQPSLHGESGIVSRDRRGPGLPWRQSFPGGLRDGRHGHGIPSS